MSNLKTLRERVEAASGRLDDETLGRIICAAHGVEFLRYDIQVGDDGSPELNVEGTSGGGCCSSITGALPLMCPSTPHWHWLSGCCRVKA